MAQHRPVVLVAGAGGAVRQRVRGAAARRQRQLAVQAGAQARLPRTVVQSNNRTVRQADQSNRRISGGQAPFGADGDCRNSF
eukprot:9467917-Pyramimonas_sp.AAC.2